MGGRGALGVSAVPCRCSSAHHWDGLPLLPCSELCLVEPLAFDSFDLFLLKGVMEMLKRSGAYMTLT